MRLPLRSVQIMISVQIRAAQSDHSLQKSIFSQSFFQLLSNTFVLKINGTVKSERRKKGILNKIKKANGCVLIQR